MFVTFEGIDGSGKTTQLKLLAENLRNGGFKVLETKEPGGTRIGRIIRQTLLNPDHTQLVPEAEMMLFMADRIQHLREAVIPALKENKIVLCDRYHDSTLAYQGGGREMDLAWMEAVKEKFIITPDITLWFDISVEESRRRLEADSDSKDCRMENEDYLFFTRVRNTYRRLCEKDPDRLVRVPSEDSVDAVQQKTLEIILAKLN